MVVVFEQFQFGFAVVENLEEEHPHQLADALGVAIDAGRPAHDVLDGFDDAAYIAHADSFVISKDSVLVPVLDGGFFILVLAAEDVVDDFHGRAHLRKAGRV